MPNHDKHPIDKKKAYTDKKDPVINYADGTSKLGVEDIHIIDKPYKKEMNSGYQEGNIFDR